MQRFWIGAAALFLTALFMYMRFPYERLEDQLEAQFRQRTSWQLQIAGLGPQPTLLGPGVAAGPVRIVTPDLEHAFERVVIRPAWSTSWLRLQPALHLDVRSAGLHVAGTLTLSAPPRFEGELFDTNPQILLGAESSLELGGQMDAEFSLTLGPLTAGPLRMSLREGVLGHPLLPLQIPYDRLDADLELGARGTITVRSAQLHSPMLTARAEGTLGMPPGGALDVKLDIEPTDDVTVALHAQGMRAGRDGRFSLHLGGTASQPTLR